MGLKGFQPRNKIWVGRKHKPDTILKMRDGRNKKSDKQKKNISQKMKGKPAWNKGGTSALKGKFGSLHPMWKGGVSPEKIKLRQSTDGQLWRKSIFIRDDFTCQKYGVRGGKLIAHHINNFEDYPEVRFALDNGITLSEKAHKEFHKKYGRRNNTREQLMEFLQ